MSAKEIRSNKLRLIKRSAALLGGLLLSVFLSAWFLLATEVGTRWIVATALSRAQSEASPGSPRLSLAASQVSGTLLHGVRAKGFTGDYGDSRLVLSDINLELGLAQILKGTLSVRRLEATASIPGPATDSEGFVVASLSGALDIAALNRFLAGEPDEQDAAAVAPIALTIDWRAENLAALEPLRASLDPASTEAVLQGSATISGGFNELAVTHDLRSPLRLHSTGTVALAPLDYAFVHGLDSLTISRAEQPLGLGPSTLATRGNAQELVLELALTSAPDAANREPSELAGSLRFDLDTLRASYALTVSDPDAFVPELSPFSLTNLRLRGGVTSGEVTSFTVDELTTLIEATPLNASAIGHFSDGEITLQDLQLATAGNRLTLSGRSGEALQLNFDLEVSDWSEFIPGARGELSARGSVAGKAQAPTTNVSVSAAGLGYAGYGLDELAVDLILEPTQDTDQIAATFTALDVTLPNAELGPIDISGKAEGTLGSHVASIVVASPIAQAEATFNGGFIAEDFAQAANSLLQPAGSSLLSEWNGSLTTARISYEPADLVLVQETAAPLVIQSAERSLNNSCWRLDTARACLDLNASSNALDASLAINDLTWETLVKIPEVAALSVGLEADSFAGKLDGSARAHLPQDGSPKIDFEAALRDTYFRLNLDSDTFSVREASLAATLDTGDWRLDSAWRVGRQAGEDAQEEAVADMGARIELTGDGELGGSITARALTLEWGSALVPQLDTMAGAFSTQLDLGGTLTAPTFSGNAELSNATATASLVGITLNEINASLRVDEDGALALTANAQSGNGRLDAALNAEGLFALLSPEALERSETAPRFEATLTGNDFLIYDTDQAKVSVSPTLLVTSAERQLTYSGSVLLSTLELTPSSLPAGAIDVSGDAVIVGDDTSSLVSEQYSLLDAFSAAGSGGELVIELGDAAHLEGFGINTGLEGELTLRETNGRSLRAYGELGLTDGNYELYGQKLAIQQGRFSFLGAIDNPGIDVRAVREIESQTVGVQMSGTLKSINSTLFSSPNLSETDIVAMLATGRPFATIGQRDQGAMLGTLASLGLERNQALTNQIRSGLGLDELSLETEDGLDNSVLTVGKYLTPKLFARYGVGLFDSRSKVSMDYTLTERLKLKAESGAQQSVDVVYAVEK